MSDTVIERQGEALQIRGEIALTNVTRLAADGERLLAKQIAEASADRVLKVDLSAVTRGDSALILLMLRWRRWAQTQGIDIWFDPIPASAQTLASLYGCADLIQSSLPNDNDAANSKSSASDEASP